MVSRDGQGWQADLGPLGVQCRARSLRRLDREMRSLVGTRPLCYRFRTGDPQLDRLVLQARAARSAARHCEERARHLTEQILTLSCGGSDRDLAVLLGLSHQRVHQLRQRAIKGGAGP